MPAPVLARALPSGDTFTTRGGNWLLPGIAGGVSGDNLAGTTSVTFNGAACTFTVVDDNDLAVTVPSSGVGPLVVTTPDGAASVQVSVPREHGDWIRDADQSDSVILTSFYRQVDASSDSDGWNGVGAAVSPDYYGEDVLTRSYDNPHSGNNLLIVQRYWHASIPASFYFHAGTDESADVVVVERDASDPDVVHWPITVETYLGGAYVDGLVHTTPSDPTQQLRLLPGEHPLVTIGFFLLPDPGWLTPGDVAAARLCLEFATPNTGTGEGGPPSDLLSFTVSESEIDSSRTFVLWSGSNYFANQVVPPSGAVPGGTAITGGVGLGGTVGREGGDLRPEVPPVARFTYTPSRYRFWLMPPTPLDFPVLATTRAMARLVPSIRKEF